VPEYVNDTLRTGMSAAQERERVAKDRIVVRFKDDEIMEGFAAGLNFDRPDFLLTVADPDSNSQSAIVPIDSVKTVLLERCEYEGVPEGRRLRKVAIRFWDGEVLKGLLASEPERRTYGMTVPVISPTLDEIEVFGIPYAAVKAIYFVKSWDARRPEFVVETGRWSLGRADTPLLDLLGEIRGLSTLRSRGDITDVEFERRRRRVLEKI
jgi:hypothetical protein